MPEGTLKVDAVVVGAGTAGANAAYQLARRGLRVIALERRSAGAAGAQWNNGVLDWQFDAAELAPPEPPERTASPSVTHLFGPGGHHGITVHDSPIVRADMGRLGARLRGLAVAAGVEVFDHVTRIAVVRDAARITALDVEVGEDAERRRSVRVEAPLFVDASGRRGVLRKASPLLARWCTPVRGDELCTASDHHVAIRDAEGAKHFLERHHANPGEGVTVVGIEGGFSTRAITVSEDLDHAAVLVGCLANGRYSSGPRMLAETRAAEPWLGDSLSGGTGVIPLRRPYARFTAPGLALVGDAACQVFPAHGSGIGFGLIAGTMLARAVEGAADPGDERTLWEHQAEFQHTYGGLLAAFDAFRRMSTALGGDGVSRMVEAGLLTESMTRAGLDQRWQGPPLDELPTGARRMASVPGVAAKMLPLLLRGQTLLPMGARYPERPDEVALARWDAQVERRLGPLPH